jgi:hypothetical protein
MTSSSNPKDSRSAAFPLFQPFGAQEDLAKVIQGQMTAAAAIPRAILEAQLTVGSELFGFIGRRLKAQAELCHELSKCREMSDALQAQRRFGERVASEYSAEVDQVTTMISRELGIVSEAASGAVAMTLKDGKLAA